MSDSIDRLHRAILAARDEDVATSKTARLLAAGLPKMGKKLAEEAVETALDAQTGDKARIVAESADLLYHLCVLWAATGIEPSAIWEEMERRERLYGIAAKVPKSDQKAGRREARADASGDPAPAHLSGLPPHRPR
ncbi:phosphoribosyl-ATP diphosphatase [Salinarimonas ramus]|uniref:Phosphoribosyl-ATP pyrophosphatase n=1 Tax=Salinarimonas ramus TaxID=690164 RepID=A0A917V9H3_9HYPH|nr:phosphoribosyl-ATP diphosphatase [Salinarimonas ramus]GGK52195.1 phosphoribosyl-ATP pyrophosphatase 2 [Salinarimonas ramus]